MYCFKSRCVLDEHCSRVVIVLFYQHLLYHELLALSLPHYKFLRAYSVTVLYLAAGLQVTSWSFSMLRTVLALWIISPRLQLPFSHFPQLRLRADSSIPTRHCFLHRLLSFFPRTVGGHSLRAGGATSLAAAGVPPAQIQAIGRWQSDTFQRYIRRQ